VSFSFNQSPGNITRNMSHPNQDDKALDGSIHEKDTQIGASEEIHIDPVAEKRVGAAHMTGCHKLTWMDSLSANWI
jgi:hypothetical protein